jgi:hypothetical protein
VDRERRPIGPSYVITEGTFLICSLGNYLIADTHRTAYDGNTNGWASELGDLVACLDAA